MLSKNESFLTLIFIKYPSPVNVWIFPVNKYFPDKYWSFASSLGSAPTLWIFKSNIEPSSKSKSPAIVRSFVRAFKLKSLDALSKLFWPKELW